VNKSPTKKRQSVFIFETRNLRTRNECEYEFDFDGCEVPDISTTSVNGAHAGEKPLMFGLCDCIAHKGISKPNPPVFSLLCLWLLS
jgi:hypothetical protein